jgi:predicted 3-demethylubiquinone-9 3-methyltransferase (glyoxalase superfamily)
MQDILVHLWFDKEAKEATAFYASLFPNSKVKSVSTIRDTPSGDCDIVRFDLAGQAFMAISAGPFFKFNPSTSLFAGFDNESEIEAAWNKLIDGGKALMPYNTYPWAKKYGWLQDRYGLSWQLSWSGTVQQKITPFLMFTGNVAGKAKEALEAYTRIFSNSKIEMVVPYAKEDGEKDGFIKYSRFTLAGKQFMAMESSGPHDFNFSEAISFIVKCENQKEVDHYWEALSADPQGGQCGWLKDKYGVSWQIVPTVLDKMLSSGEKDKVSRVTQAFLKMKKFDIETLEHAYDGR